MLNEHYNYKMFNGNESYIFNIETVIQKMLQYFEYLFIVENSKHRILSVIQNIKDNKPILNLCENDIDISFSTIFLPFMPEYFTQAQDYNNTKLYVHIKLVEFMNLCKDIEMLTDEYPLLQEENKEPSDQDKKRLLLLLERFLQILPNSLEEFKSWIKLEK